MSKILYLNIVHLNTCYQRTMERNEKMFCKLYKPYFKISKPCLFTLNGADLEP